MIQRLLTAPFRRLMEGQKEMRRSQLQLLPPPPGALVFLGDSITEQGNWDEWFPEHRTLNRGVGGDTVQGTTARLGNALNEPRLVSLLIGTNDLGGAGATDRVPDIAAQMGRLVAQIRTQAPNAVLLINSVMPRQRRFAQRVQELNESYRRIAAQAQAEYIDLWPVLADQAGALRDEFTEDGLHLRGEGYLAWAEALSPHVNALGPTRSTLAESEGTE